MRIAARNRGPSQIGMTATPMETEPAPVVVSARGAGDVDGLHVVCDGLHGLPFPSCPLPYLERPLANLR
jgi:hypothetical protein